jgi:PadR family transcriptional regulator PadR
MELLQGTLDVLILKGLSWVPRHGYAVARWIEQTSESIQVLDGALYTSLHRMQLRGWISSSWGTSDKGRRAKFYALTPAGRKQLSAEVASWGEYAAAIGRVLKATTHRA